jgi:GNAT superfamily N-acetyltransferase
MHEVVIRQKLNEQEKLEIQKLFQKVYNGYGGPGYLEYLVNSVSDNTWFILLKWQNYVVATSAVYKMSERTGEVFFVAVDPKCRGQGLGMAVNQASEAFARDLGLEVLYTGPLINFHELQNSNWCLNLGNLVITQKQGFTLTGFTLGQYIDFTYKPSGLPEGWIQNLSGCLMAKLLSNSEKLQQDFQQECLKARTDLISALQGEGFHPHQKEIRIPLEINEMDGGLDAEGNPTIIISKLGFSQNLEDLLATLNSEEPFVPCGYYPSYRRMGETYYVGLNIQHLVSLNPDDNLWGIDRNALFSVITEPDRVLFDLVVRSMTLTFRGKN